MIVEVLFENSAVVVVVVVCGREKRDRDFLWDIDGDMSVLLLEPELL